MPGLEGAQLTQRTAPVAVEEEGAESDERLSLNVLFDPSGPFDFGYPKSRLDSSGEAPKRAGEIQARMLIYQIARVLMPVVIASRLLHGDDAGFNTEASNSRLFSGYQMLRNDR